MNDSQSRRIDGGCHCGNIRFVFDWPEAATTIPGRACGCTFCCKHGAAYTSHPRGRLEVTIADPEQVHDYRFGTGTADFMICRTCGVVPVVTSAIDGTLYAVVSVNAFESADRADVEVAAADFEGEATDDRLARRRRNWIGDVTVVRGAP